ncbi:hypothetical protein NDM98_08305 [Shouchella plakortidis]|uniref:ApeA N-terminal domain-containing protein n=1 Tax=Alkalicoccobacillus plakortidis TaxID=444060 RepID=A0ABT0XHX6_9BACI|nr:hypothetical protein [Alkalicoccobacillus plakortidis]MCM2675489.1 hypothetical protein [Alkalicoccobacillus plakortidis]
MSKKKAKDFLMNEEFEVKGYWSFINSDYNVPGSLIYSKDGIKLELLGNLHDHSIELLVTESKIIDIIIGTSLEGEKFTLLNSFTINKKLNFPGYATEIYNVSSILVGEHFTSLESITFYSARFHPTYLTKWIGRAPFKENYEHDINSNALKNAELVFTAPKTFRFNIHSIDSELSEEFNLNTSASIFEHMGWNFKSYLKLKLLNPQD